MMRSKVLVLGGLALSLAGCSVWTASYNDGSGIGGAVVGSLGAPVAAPLPPPASKGAFLEGPLGQRLGEADRQRAFQAEIDALQSDQRKTWRGVQGNFGFVVPAASVGADGCRAFTQTVYVAGRPQSGTGMGCPAPDGSWRVTG